MRNLIFVLSLFFIGFAAQPVMATSDITSEDAVMIGCQETVQVQTQAKDLAEVLRPIFENLLGWDSMEIAVVDPDEEEEDCKVTIKGTVKEKDEPEKELDLTVTVHDKSCTEILRELLNG